MDNAQTNDAAWAGDLFDRKTESDYLIETLANLYQREGEAAKKSLVLAVNAEWGAGKTFFLRYFARDIEEAGHPVICFDAWANDYAEDALLSFLAEMMEQLAEKLPKHHQVVAQVKEKAVAVVKAVAKVGLNAALKKGIGIGLDELSDEIKPKEDKDGDDLQGKLQDAIGNAIFDSHKSKKQAIEDFRVALRGLLANIADNDKRKPPIFVLVDELDRCRPDFSIKLLEGIKHIFAVEGVYFVLGINQRQLQESIKVLYGNSFEAHSYLKRFIDVEYQLTSPNSVEFVRHLFKRNGYNENSPGLLCPGTPSAIDYLSYIFTAFGLALRDQEQIAFQLFSICDVIIGRGEKVFFPYLAILLCAKFVGKNVSDDAQLRECLEQKSSGASSLIIFDGTLDRFSSTSSLELGLHAIWNVHDSIRKQNYTEYSDGKRHPAWGRYFSTSYPSSYSPPGPLPCFSNYPQIVKRAGLVKI
jgi:hypothetical protein